MTSQWPTVVGTRGGVAVTAMAGFISARLTGRQQHERLVHDASIASTAKLREERRLTFLQFLSTGSKAAAAARIEAGHAVRARAELLGRLRSCFARTRTWQHAGRYLSAVASEIPQRNGWTITEQVGDRTPDRTQQLLNRAVWDTVGVMGAVRRFVAVGLDVTAGFQIEMEAHRARLVSEPVTARSEVASERIVERRVGWYRIRLGAIRRAWLRLAILRCRSPCSSHARAWSRWWCATRSGRAASTTRTRLARCTAVVPS
jgi:hypothetical protein